MDERNSLEPHSANPASQQWVTSGDYELNFAALCGAPTLRPSPALEQMLGLPSVMQASEGESTLLDIGVHLHAYHVQECQQILHQLSQSLPSCDLLITTDSDLKRTAIEDQLNRFSSQPWVKRLEVRVVTNHGRNIVPLLRDGLDFLKPCKLALHLHTKRTDHKTFGNSWFTELLDSLVGDSVRVRNTIEAFASDPDLGLAMPQAGELIRPYLNWGANFDIAAVLVQSLWPGRKLSIQAPLVFPQGMMFWFRPQALAPLAPAINLLEPLPLEPLLQDGTPLHALERLTAHACEMSGLRWALLPSGDNPTHPSSEPWRTKLSVWDPKPEAYLAGVAALAEQQRRMQTRIDEQEVAYAALDKHRESLEQTLQKTAFTAIEKHRESLEETLRAIVLTSLDRHRESLEETLREIAFTAINKHHASLKETMLARDEDLATVKELEAEILTLQQSLSWRLTEPLRKAKQFLWP
jgi:hypothetical protein